MANLRPQFQDDQERLAYLDDMRGLAAHIDKRVDELNPKVTPTSIYDLRDAYPDREYYILISGRGRAKSDNVIEYLWVQCIAYGKECVFVRRRPESFEAGRGQSVTKDLYNTEVTPDGRNFFEWLTMGLANGVKFRTSAWWLIYTDPETGKITYDDEPIMYAAGISTGDDTSKGMQLPKCDYIILDEVTKRQKGDNWPYLPGEEIDYFNLQKTIFRGRPSANSVWMLGNAVNKTCPILQQMGLRHFGRTTPGDIQDYTSRTEDGETHILFYNLPPAKVDINYTGKTADRFFCFDTPEIRQITHGEWEVHEYPLISGKEGHEASRERTYFYLEYNGEKARGAICWAKGIKPYLYFCNWTTKLDEERKALVYSDRYSLRPNWRRMFDRPKSKLEEVIVSLYMDKEVYYSSNYVGETVSSFLAWSKTQ